MFHIEKKHKISQRIVELQVCKGTLINIGHHDMKLARIVFNLLAKGITSDLKKLNSHYFINSM